jgi:hypothetical protein
MADNAKGTALSRHPYAGEAIFRGCREEFDDLWAKVAALDKKAFGTTPTGRTSTTILKKGAEFWDELKKRSDTSISAATAFGDWLTSDDSLAVHVRKTVDPHGPHQEQTVGLLTPLVDARQNLQLLPASGYQVNVGEITSGGTFRPVVIADQAYQTRNSQEALKAAAEIAPVEDVVMVNVLLYPDYSGTSYSMTTANFTLQYDGTNKSIANSEALQATLIFNGSATFPSPGADTQPPAAIDVNAGMTTNFTGTIPELCGIWLHPTYELGATGTIPEFNFIKGYNGNIEVANKIALFRWFNFPTPPSNCTLSYLGRFGSGTIQSDGVTWLATADAVNPIILKAYSATQSGHLLKLVDSAGVFLAGLAKTGQLYIGDESLSGYAVNVAWAKVTSGSMGGQWRLVDTTAYNSTPIAGLYLGGRYDSSNNTALWGGISATKENATDGEYGGYLSLHTRANGAAIAEVMRLASNKLATFYGNVLINPSDNSLVCATIKAAASPATDILRVTDSADAVKAVINSSYRMALGTGSPSSLALLHLYGGTNDGSEGIFIQNFAPNIKFWDRSSGAIQTQIICDGSQLRFAVDANRDDTYEISAGCISSTGKLYWGAFTDATSTVQIGGSFACPYTAVVANYTVTATDFMVAVTTGASGKTITLPTAIGITGRMYCVVKIDAGAGAVTVDGNASETINGATTVSLAAQWDRLAIMSNGANWVRID